MDYLKVKIYTTSQGVESVTGRLYNLGINGFEIEDEHDFDNFLQNESPSWDCVDDSVREGFEKGVAVIKVYLSNDNYGKENLELIRADLKTLKATQLDYDLGTLNILLENVKDEDWANNWKQYFTPIKLGEKIFIKPSWQELDGLDVGERKIFEVDPGMMFGTGLHESTRLCIRALEKYLKKDQEILDIGCGSGILSIISVLLEAKSVNAVDIDPNVFKVMEKNIALNNHSMDKYTIMAGDVLTDSDLRLKLGEKSYDTVFANIIADVLIPLAPFVRNCLKQGGIFISGGIILDRKKEVEETFRVNGFEILETIQEGEWVAMVAKCLDSL